ncbi:MAG TPA: hypothetical protein VFZ02_03075 [Ktedonobacteraceae bacterium]
MCCKEALRYLSLCQTLLANDSGNGKRRERRGRPPHPRARTSHRPYYGRAGQASSIVGAMWWQSPLYRFRQQSLVRRRPSETKSVRMSLSICPTLA